MKVIWEKKEGFNIIGKFSNKKIKFFLQRPLLSINKQFQCVYEVEHDTKAFPTKYSTICLNNSTYEEAKFNNCFMIYLKDK